MSNTQVIKFSFYSFLLLFAVKLNAQKTSNEYWQASLEAGKHYDNADYHKAAAAFEILWTKPYEQEIANDRLYAAAANCMIDNEEGVRKNLFKIISVASKTDMKRILVNYEIFNKYKHLDWWQELEDKLNKRLQNLIAHHKNLRIFKKGRNIVYSAVRININGDTLANTTVTMIPDGTGWGNEAALSQSQVIYVYESTSKDSLEHIQEVDSVVGKRFWNCIDTTGIIENSKEVWIHPFRNNEFYKTEIAAFPTVVLPLSDTTLQSMNGGSTHIMGNWGLYNNTETKQSFEYINKELKFYSDIGEIECHKIIGIGDNSRYGKSMLEFYFNEDYGFTEMNYLTYDGDSILFKIIKVINMN